MSNFWEKYQTPPQTPAVQNQQGQQVMPDPFGGPQEMNRQFREFVGNYRGNPQEDLKALQAKMTPFQRQIMDRLVPAVMPLIQGGRR